MDRVRAGVFGIDFSNLVYVLTNGKIGLVSDTTDWQAGDILILVLEDSIEVVGKEWSELIEAIAQVFQSIVWEITEVERLEGAVGFHVHEYIDGVDHLGGKVNMCLKGLNLLIERR